MKDSGESQDARSRLVAAGLELFGRYGFEGVTTRALAAAAGVNQSAIPYYFGGKEGVFLAVAEHVCDTAGGKIAALVETVRARLGEKPDRSTAEAMLVELASRLCHLMLRADSPASRFVFANRDQTEPAQAFELIYERFLEPVHSVAAELLGHLSGEPPHAVPTILLAQSFLGQILAFASGRALLQRRLGGAGGYTPAQIEAIVATAERISRLMLAGLRQREPAKNPS